MASSLDLLEMLLAAPLPSLTAMGLRALHVDVPGTDFHVGVIEPAAPDRVRVGSRWGLRATTSILAGGGRA